MLLQRGLNIKNIKKGGETMSITIKNVSVMGYGLFELLFVV